MEQILEGLLESQQPDGVKNGIINRICDQGTQQNHPASAIKAVFQVSCKWVLHGTTALQVSSGFKLLNTWGVHNLESFLSFFTPEFVSQVLNPGYGTDANVPLLIREGLRVLSHMDPSCYVEHTLVVQRNITRFITGTSDCLLVRNVGLLLSEFTDCIPAIETNINDFCLAVIQLLSVAMQPTDGKVMKLMDEIGNIFNLALNHRYTLLVQITETNTEKVVDNLDYQQHWNASFKIFSQMLLSYQRSPSPFHKALEKVPCIIAVLRKEGTKQSQANLLKLSQLLHCLMYQHTGFPELYDPILDLIKDLPTPSTDEIKTKLQQTKWSSLVSDPVPIETACTATLSTAVKHQKLETDKTGLENLGNTCYMNSVLQALYMCDQFRRGILNKPPSGRETLLVELQHVFAMLSQSSRPAIAPTKFLQASRPPWFQPGHQQDCSEFLKYLLDQLHEDEKTASAKTLMKSPSTGSMSMYQQPPTLVENTFRGKVQTTLRCLACKQESQRVESFSDIPLAFPNASKSSDYPHKILVGGSGVPTSNSVPESPHSEKSLGFSSMSEGSKGTFTLNDLISFYLKPEMLTGDNKYHCYSCGKLQDGEKKIHILESPQYLILTLLRFSYDTKLQSRTKIFQDVHYPRTMAVPVCKHASSPTDSKTNQLKQQEASVSNSLKLKAVAQKLAPSCEGVNPGYQFCDLYGLSAVIVHSGESSECGHYYCYARHSDAGQIDLSLLDRAGEDYEHLDLLPDKWYNFNDSRVSHANFETFRLSKDTAYVLIYRKIDTGGQSLAIVSDPILRPDLRDAVVKDNEAYQLDQEQEAKAAKQRRCSSSVLSTFRNWRDNRNDHDDDGGGRGGPPGCVEGFCGGLDTSGSKFF